MYWHTPITILNLLSCVRVCMRVYQEVSGSYLILSQILAYLLVEWLINYR